MWKNETVWRSECLQWRRTTLWNLSDDLPFKNYYFSRRIIALQYCVGFCCTSTSDELLLWVCGRPCVVIYCLPVVKGPPFSSRLGLFWDIYSCHVLSWVSRHIPLVPQHPCQQNEGSVSSVQSLSCVWLFATPWTAACQASLAITNSQSLHKLMSIESLNQWCHPTISSSVDPSPLAFNVSQDQGLFK